MGSQAKTTNFKLYFYCKKFINCYVERIGPHRLELYSFGLLGNK